MLAMYYVYISISPALAVFKNMLMGYSHTADTMEISIDLALISHFSSSPNMYSSTCVHLWPCSVHFKLAVTVPLS